MSTTEFEAFTEAMARRPAPPAPAVPAFGRVTVLGGGPEGRLLASLCLAEGSEVTLFSAYGAELAAIRSAGGTTLRGAGPVGAFPAGREDGPSIRLSAELDVALRGADLVFVTGPVLKQRTYAMVLAEHLADGQVLALVPGRSLGALEAAWYLRVGGCEADVVLAEVQALPYWIREDGPTLHLTRARPAPAAALPSDREDVVRGTRRFLPGLVPVRSVAESGFADGSGLVEGPGAPPRGARRPRRGAGAAPRARSPSRSGTRSAPSSGATPRGDRGDGAGTAAGSGAIRRSRPSGYRRVARCLRGSAGRRGGAAGAGRRPGPAGSCADAVVGSLTPLVSASEVAGTPAPVTRAMTTLAQTVLGSDLAHAGRRLDTIGIGGGRPRRRPPRDGCDRAGRPLMDADLRSIASARRAAERAWEAWLAFRETPPETIDSVVEGMALAIEPEAERLARLAVEETGYGNVPDKRLKNLFNSLSVAEWLRNVRTLGVLWRDEAAKVAAIGEPMGVVAALIPVTNPTSTVISRPCPR